MPIPFFFADYNQSIHNNTSLIEESHKFVMPSTIVEYFDPDIEKIKFNFSDNILTNYIENYSSTTVHFDYGKLNIAMTEEEDIGFFNDNYDLFIKLPKFKKIKMRAKISSVRKFRPNPSI